MFCRLLAKKGQNVVLISRNASKLQTVAKEIQDEFKVETKTIRVDFTQDESIYDEIRKEISDLDIGVLVNNMGIAYPFPEYFLKIEDLSGTILNMIRGNIMSTVKMVEVVLPGRPIVSSLKCEEVIYTSRPLVPLTVFDYTRTVWLGLFCGFFKSCAPNRLFLMCSCNKLDVPTDSC